MAPGNKKPASSAPAAGKKAASNAPAAGKKAASDAPAVGKKAAAARLAAPSAPNPMARFLRAEGEDDDGYDPFSDRPARPEPLFERDPWD
ncbi:MAG: hypothetical protein ACOX4F_09380 [Atopobiaceae bacterium]